MNLRDLQYLVAVADHRHFGKAAEACFVSQPTLSAQIKKLERELGVELFERHPRQVLLTEAGAQIVERARGMLSTAADIDDIARRAKDPEAGTVRLGLIPTLAPYLLAHVVAPLRQRFPHLELLLVEDKTEVLHQQLREGRLDAAVLALPLSDDQLHEEFLFAERFVLAVPSGHALGARAEVGTDVLAGEPVLLLEEGHCLRDQALSVCHLAGATERSDFRATSLETLRQMVAAGVGITLLPELAVASPVSPTTHLTVVPFAAPAPQREVGMVWRRSTVNGPLFVEMGRVMRQAVLPVLHPPDADVRRRGGATARRRR
jgi:LysR family hydrogen peroxide-inducible transcriptional activator